MVNASWLLALITVCAVVCLSSVLRVYLLARQVRAHEARQAHVYANQRVSSGASGCRPAPGRGVPSHSIILPTRSAWSSSHLKARKCSSIKQAKGMVLFTALPPAASDHAAS